MEVCTRNHLVITQDYVRMRHTNRSLRPQLAVFIRLNHGIAVYEQTTAFGKTTQTSEALQYVSQGPCP
jgi:hypothetical protein